MAVTPKTFRILSASAIALALVGGAYWLAGSPKASIADAESTEALLRAYAEKDTDADGLYDWQESLYGADPENAHSLDATLTDKAAVESGKVAPKFAADTSSLDETSDESVPGIEAEPTTLTDRFAREFFENFLAEKGAGALPSAEDLEAFVTAEINNLSSQNAVANKYSAASITTNAAGPDALRAYARTVETAVSPYSAQNEESEIVYFGNAIYSGDMKQLVPVRRAASFYKNIGAAFIKVPVPSEAAQAHLRVANAMAKLGTIIDGMGTLDTDPLQAFVSASAYEASVVELKDAFASLYRSFENQNVVISETETGGRFYAALKNSAATP